MYYDSPEGAVKFSMSQRLLKSTLWSPFRLNK